jgi:outer membrane lipoprotein LolB
LNHRPHLKSTTGLLAFIFLAGCSGIQATRPNSAEQAALYGARFNVLLGLDDWAFEGRLAVNDGKDGGSGNLDWHRQGEASNMSFHGAFGRGAWRVQATPEGAVLELADGAVYRASSVEALLQQQLGWEVPFEALEWWVRGLAAPGDQDVRELGEQGKLLALTQLGWVIEYGKYSDADGVLMPRKLTARQGSHTVKLAVREWNLGRSTGRSE